MALTVLVLAGVALGVGLPTGLVVVGLAAALQPVLAIVALAGWAVSERVRRRSDVPGADDAAAFLMGVAAELAAGSPPRASLVAAASRAPRLDLRSAVRLASAGMGSDRIAAELESCLPIHGRLAAAAWSLTATSGGPAASVFEVLAVRAAEEGSLIRERRVLTAQARASAWVVAGLPVLLLVGMLASGRLRIGSDPALTVVLVAGIGLQVLGVAVVWSMLRRAM